MRYKITIEYDGTDLLGWQKQLDGPSVQEHLEKALLAFAGKHVLAQTSGKNGSLTPVSSQDKTSGALSAGEQFLPDDSAAAGLNAKTIIQGAGRTDAGVHALGQVAHFDLDAEMDCFRIREAFNAHLRLADAPVSVLNVEQTDDGFHARFSAKGRGYIYRILCRRAPSVLQKNRVWWVPVPLHIEKMRQGAAYLLGHHDFSSFRAAACQAKSPLKTLDRLDIEQCGEEIIFTVEARSFLHHQVRNMVGTLKMVGDGHLRPEDVKTILKAKKRSAGGVNAPACGLYLNKVVY